MMIAGFASSPSAAYHGGPLIVELLGYEPKDAKVYYWLHDGSEAANPRRTFYFDLDSSSPTIPVHAISLDVPVDSVDTGIGARRFRAIRKRLRPLEELRDYDVQLSVHADSVGFDERNKVVQYRVHADLRAGNAAQGMDLDAYCRSTAAIRGVYRVPSRSELLVVLTYVGRAYYCEDVQQPILLIGLPRTE